MTTIVPQIFTKTTHLPVLWDDIAGENVFLSRKYLEILTLSAPQNMSCYFIGFYQSHELVGIALAQFIDLNKLETFGERDKCVKAMVRNFVIRNFASHVLFMGNNMLTGQNAYCFKPKIDPTLYVPSLARAIDDLIVLLKSKGQTVHIVSIKDFELQEVNQLKNNGFENYLQFSTQPNMVFDIENNWKNEPDYVNALTKKYRDQYKRSRKKSIEITKLKLDLGNIIKHEEKLYDLYHYVAQNAPFNTFFLQKNHFQVLKRILKDDFLVYGYFFDNELIGFNTLIKNGAVMDTYFLGYDDSIQRDKMLYINMLYDMIGYSIKEGFTKIIFARTALEIKSSVGAKPLQMFGLLKHSNKFINKFAGKIFSAVEPKVYWQERNPFK